MNFFTSEKKTETMPFLSSSTVKYDGFISIVDAPEHAGKSLCMTEKFDPHNKWVYKDRVLKLFYDEGKKELCSIVRVRDGSQAIFIMDNGIKLSLRYENNQFVTRYDGLEADVPIGKWEFVLLKNDL